MYGLLYSLYRTLLNCIKIKIRKKLNEKFVLPMIIEYRRNQRNQRLSCCSIVLRYVFVMYIGAAIDPCWLESPIAVEHQSPWQQANRRADAARKLFVNEYDTIFFC